MLTMGASGVLSATYATASGTGAATVYGALVLTDASRAVLKGERNVTLRRYVKPTKVRQTARSGARRSCATE